jgi:hypothetical protein
MTNILPGYLEKLFVLFHKPRYTNFKIRDLAAINIQ